nr:unnamed protein product [Callosobruchus chinensis]
MVRRQKGRTRDIGVTEVEPREGSIVPLLLLLFTKSIPRRFKAQIDGIKEHARANPRQYVILGDFNSKSPLWGPQSADRRGDYLSEWIAELDLVVHNSGNNQRFGEGQNLARAIDKWFVSDTESMSDHLFIFFDLQVQHTSRRRIVNGVRKVDWKLFRQILEWKIDLCGKAHNTSESFNRIIRETYTDSSHVNRWQDRKMPFWWNEESRHTERNAYTKEGN